jgi:hypothetical protein
MIQNYRFEVFLTEDELLFVDQAEDKVSIRMVFNAQYQKHEKKKL